MIINKVIPFLLIKFVHIYSEILVRVISPYFVLAVVTYQLYLVKLYSVDQSMKIQK